MLNISELLRFEFKDQNVKIQANLTVIAYDIKNHNTSLPYDKARLMVENLTGKETLIYFKKGIAVLKVETPTLQHLYELFQPVQTKLFL